MATIPTGNGGRRIPGQNVQVQGVGAAALAPARALEDLGQTGVQIATNFMAKQTQLDAQELRQQQAVAEAAARAKDAVQLQTTEDKLADLHDEIGAGVLQGGIAKTDAEKVWQERSRKVIDEQMPLMREQTRTLVEPRLTSTVGRFGNSIRRTVEKKDRQDVTADMSTRLERLSRDYMTDPARAEAEAMTVIDTLGPFSSMNPEQIGKARQGWKEQAQYTAGSEAVSKARANRAAIPAAEQMIGKLQDIDPMKRAQLLDRLSGYRLHFEQQDELRAQRAQRESERKLKQAEAEFNTFQAIADNGTVLDPSYVDRVVAATAGTPYQSGVRTLAQQVRETGGLAARPVQEQQALLDQVDAQIAQQGRSQELDRRRSQIEKVLSGSRADMERDPLRAGLERGVITELQPLNLQGGMQGIVEQIAGRVVSAQQVSTWAGRPVSPLTSDEAATLNRQLDALPAKDRSSYVAAMAGVLDSRSAQALAVQLDKHDRSLALAFANAGTKTTEGRFVSELILKGQDAKKDGTSTKGEKSPDVKAANWKAFAASEVEGMFPSQQTAGQVRDAAELIMHGIAAEQGGQLSKADMERAVRLAVGGSVYEHNGRKIPLPAGVDSDALDKRLRSVTAGEINAPGGVVRSGGVDMPVSQFLQALPGQQLMPVRPGEFAVIVGGRPVVNSQGKPVTVRVQ